MEFPLIGEIADSLEINLDVLPLKYEGLNGTELAGFRNLKKEWR